MTTLVRASRSIPGATRPEVLRAAQGLTFADLAAAADGPSAGVLRRLARGRRDERVVAALLRGGASVRSAVPLTSLELVKRIGPGVPVTARLQLAGEGTGTELVVELRMGGARPAPAVLGLPAQPLAEAWLGAIEAACRGGPRHQG